ncbi:MAG TPA: hypothetical protein VN782_06260 [Usitatibacter sp.]|nr:hypothetical protein [Usitatibacter sp.]
MSTYQMRYHPAAVTPGGRWLITGFICGGLSVLIFHQGAFALLNLAHFTHHPLYSATATHPFGVPTIWSQVFWGAVWGLIFAAFFMGLWGGALLVAGSLFGAFALSVVAWFVVAPIKGQAIAGGAVPMAMAAAFLANGAWGFGTALGLVLFGRPR